MDDELRAMIVRRLRATADRIAAGDDAAARFYIRDPDEGRDYDHDASRAQTTCEIYFDNHRDAASEAWHPEMTDLEWGIEVPVQVCRQTEEQPTPCHPDWDERWEYALVDPDHYASPAVFEPERCGECNTCEAAAKAAEESND